MKTNKSEQIKEFFGYVILIMLVLSFILFIVSQIMYSITTPYERLSYAEGDAMRELRAELVKLPEEKQQDEIEYHYLEKLVKDDPSNESIRLLSLIYKNDTAEMIESGKMYDWINSLVDPYISRSLNIALYFENLNSESTNVGHNANLVRQDILFNLLKSYIISNEDTLSEEEIESLKNRFLSSAKTICNNEQELAYFEYVLDK